MLKKIFFFFLLFFFFLNNSYANGHDFTPPPIDSSLAGSDIYQEQQETKSINAADKKSKSTHSQMLPGDNDNVIDNKLVGDTGEKQVDSIFAWIRDSMEALLPIVAVGVFLFVGIRIAMAKGNPEEFKKAWMQMVYAVIGIFVVGFAWAAVKLVAGLNI